MLKAVTMLCAACFAVPCFAQGSSASYNVSHTFAYTPPAGVTPLVAGVVFEHAWVKTWGFRDFGVVPQIQAPGFDPYGTDSPSALGAAVNHPSNGAPDVNCLFSSFAIPPAGINYSHCTTVVAPNNTNASACTGFDIQPYGPGQTIRGTVSSAGAANAWGVGFNEAYAFSSAAVGLGQVGYAGQIQWTTLIDGVSGWAHATQQSDPIVLTVRDVNGAEATAVLLNILYTTESNDRVNWSNGVFTTDARNATLAIGMDRRVVLNGGTARLIIQNGVVTTSLATGPFAGMLPPLGATSPVQFPLPNDIPINYDGTGMLPGHLADAHLHMGGAGEGSASSGCPADFNNDGQVDFFDYLDFVSAFSEGGDNADFNGDGQVDFFDYLDFVLAYDQGCGG